MVQKYSKKPVIIEALQFKYDQKSIDELKLFAGKCFGNITKKRHMGALAYAEIKTLEDGVDDLTVVHIATEGDFIIKGIQGEFYACKPDIFKDSYDVVE